MHRCWTSRFETRCSARRLLPFKSSPVCRRLSGQCFRISQSSPCSCSSSWRASRYHSESYVITDRSLLTLFRAMVGNFEFDDIYDDFESCPQPRWARDTGIGLLVFYLIVMAILLLNLLIAVLSTVHSEVYAHSTQEFHLARARVIHQTCRALLYGRLPPPLNLAMPVLGVIGDAMAEIFHLIIIG